MRLVLLALALFQAAQPSVPAVNPTLSVWFSNRTTACTWTPASVPATGRVLVAMTDQGANVSATGEVDAMPRGNRQLVVWYLPKTGACPTIDGVTATK